jgi:hypothetical protein
MFKGLERIPVLVNTFNKLNMESFLAQIRELTVALKPFVVQVERLAKAFQQLPAKFRNVASAAKSVSKANETLTVIQEKNTAVGTKQGSMLRLLSSAFNKASKSAGTFSSRMRLSSSGLSMSTVVNTGLLVTAIYALSRAFASCIENVNEYIESMNLAQTVMGSDTFTAAAGTLNGITFDSDYDISTGTGNGFWTKAQDVMGIDAGEAIKYQAVFMDIVTGMGVGADAASTMSKQLTQLGYDISSFNNISVAESMKKIQSGISGELEPMRRIGYDLSVARLQQDALTAGISGTVQEMTQAEKVQLRYYEMMTQITEAHGDLARTLNSPANQIRVLSAQVQVLARNFGSLLLPALNAIVPALTAIVKLFNELVADMAYMIGVDLSDYLADLSTVDYSSMLDQSDDLTDSLDDATDSAKELKNQLMGFDEINKFSSTSDSSGDDDSDGLGSLSDLDSLSYDFFEGLAASNVNTILQNMKDAIASGDWYQIGKDIAQSITSGLNTMIGIWPTIQKTFREGAWNLATMLNGMFSNRNFSFGLGDNFAQAINTMFQSGLVFVRRFNFGQFGEFIANGFNAAVRNINFDSITLFYTEGMNGIFESIQAFFSNGKFEDLGSSVGEALSRGMLSIDFALIGSTIALGINSVKDTLAAAFDALNGDVDEGGIRFGNGLNNLTSGIEWRSIGETLAAGFMDIVNYLGAALKTFNVDALIEGVNELISNALANVEWENVGYDIGQFLGEAAKAVVGIVFNLETWIQIAQAIVEALSGAIMGLWNSGGLLDFVTLIFPAGKIADLAGNVFKGVSTPIVDALIQASTKGNEIVLSGVNVAKETVTGAWEAVLGFAKNLSESFKGVIKGVVDFFGVKFTEAKGVAKGALDSISGFFSWCFGSAQSVIRTCVLFIESAFNNLGSFLKNVINVAFIDPINLLIRSAIKGVAGIVNIFSKYTGFKIDTSNIFQIPRLASGGQLNDGQMFIAREAGPEMVGTMGNKTTVANNEQIIQGIESGVFSAMMQVLPYFTQDSSNGGGDVTITLQVGNEELARATNKGNASLARRGLVKSELAFVG